MKRPQCASALRTKYFAIGHKPGQRCPYPATRESRCWTHWMVHRTEIENEPLSHAIVESDKQ